MTAYRDHQYERLLVFIKVGGGLCAEMFARSDLGNAGVN